jgi:hypothetical protein
MKGLSSGCKGAFGNELILERLPTFNGCYFLIRRSQRGYRPRQLNVPYEGSVGRTSDALTMAQPTHMDIVRRAYQLWQQAGEPQGKDQEFYHLAEQELRNQDKSSPLRTPDNL